MYVHFFLLFIFICFGSARINGVPDDCHEYCRAFDRASYCKMNREEFVCQGIDEDCTPGHACAVPSDYVAVVEEVEQSQFGSDELENEVEQVFSDPLTHLQNRRGSSGGRSGCEAPADEEVTTFWWTEWPSMEKNWESWTAYYDRLFALLTQNCAAMRVTTLILRVHYPQFPHNMDDKIWWPDEDVRKSPLYTHLLSKLSSTSVTSLRMLPYLHDEMARSNWRAYRNTGEILPAVYRFMEEWNDALPFAKFTGVVVDYEELMNSGIFAALDNPHGRVLVTGGSNLKFGIAIGFDMWDRFARWSWVDEFYMQAYDFFRPRRFVANFADSPFLLYKNDPMRMLHYVVHEAMDAVTKEQWELYRNKVMCMWSLQSYDEHGVAGAGCHYPLATGRHKCGYNHEFGHWNAKAFNLFLRFVERELAFAQQGIYHYEYLPREMLPMNMQNCNGNGCHVD